MSDKQKVTLEDIVSLCKRRGFIFQGSEIYGGLAGTWDYGPLGSQLKRNIEQAWWKMFVDDRDDMYGLDSAILMNPKVWQASGHTGAGFADPLVEDLKSGKRYRADHLLEDNGIEDAEEMTFDQMNKVIAEKAIKSPDGNGLSEVRTFNMMFETQVGPVQTDDSKSYLRPEIAQGMFVNFKNVVDSMQPNIPFGLAQSGKAFRNEISPREFLFRVREFNLMEFEYFIHESMWEERFEHFRQQFYVWCSVLGLAKEKIHELEVPEADRAHYSKRTIDFEYAFSFGTKEIGAIAYRTDFDLSNHQEHSGEKMLYRPKDQSEPFVPHVIEPTFGLDRFLLATLSEAYTVAEDGRVFLALPHGIAPIKYCVSPLLKNKIELVAKAREVYLQLQKKYGKVAWVDNGNICKRYRRQDEIGTPYCIVIDFDTLEDDTVTVRDRDTTEQKRLPISELLK
jgi:glycyl-tRNA synthetase